MLLFMLMFYRLSAVATTNPSSAVCTRPNRNYTRSPIVIVAPDNGKNYERTIRDCSVDCVITGDLSRWARADGWLERLPRRPNGQLTRRPRKKCPLQQYILLSLESEAYYTLLRLSNARNQGWDILASTNDLEADVQLDYAGRKYDWFADPVPFKNKSVAAAVFISNCAAKNDRLELVDALMKAGFPVHSYGKCLHNAEAGAKAGAKTGTLRRHLFSLAFENSNVRGYVTEKFYQSLAAGSVPVYLGAPNIKNFSPTPYASASVVVVDQVVAAAAAAAAAGGGSGKAVSNVAVGIKARALAARLWELARDETAYSAMLALKKQRTERSSGGRTAPVLLGPLREVVERPGSNCRICVALKETIEKGLLSSPKASAGQVKRLPATENMLRRVNSQKTSAPQKHLSH